jgi:predicted SprT family Zn-dependent metalloprotease
MEDASPAALTPTEATYQALQTAYDHFNGKLFQNQLPPCLITLSRRDRRTYGHFAPARFREIEGQRRTDEIAMNPQHFLEQPMAEVLSTLAHEMAHLWQAHFGKPSRSSYHNRQWGGKMKEIGLYPSSTGRPDGKETGQHMSHYTIKDGPFDSTCKRLLSDGFTLAWGELLSQVKKHKDRDDDDEDEDRTNRVKYTCPQCSVNAWGKPDLSLICGVCTVQLEAAE